MIEAIPALSHLVVIDIVNCGLIKLPEEFALLRNIECLEAQDNQITKIPKWICKICGTDALIRLDRNQISKIPSWLNNVCSRQVRIRVSLRDNPIRVADVRCVMNSWCSVDKSLKRITADHYAAYKDVISDTNRSEMYPETCAALEYLESVYM
jgi:Leucine-rich repeat (LRR) protein